jgi:hypothetical protein
MLDDDDDEEGGSRIDEEIDGLGMEGERGRCGGGVSGSRVYGWKPAARDRRRYVLTTG